jgi:hypothetical protein
MVTGPPTPGPGPRYGPSPRYMPDSLRAVRYRSLGASLRPGIQDQAAWNEQMRKVDHDRQERAASGPSPVSGPPVSSSSPSPVSPKVPTARMLLDPPAWMLETQRITALYSREELKQLLPSYEEIQQSLADLRGRRRDP